MRLAGCGVVGMDAVRFQTFKNDRTDCKDQLSQEKRWIKVNQAIIRQLEQVLPLYWNGEYSQRCSLYGKSRTVFETVPFEITSYTLIKRWDAEIGAWKQRKVGAGDKHLEVINIQMTLKSSGLDELPEVNREKGTGISNFHRPVKQRIISRGDWEWAGQWGKSGKCF